MKRRLILARALVNSPDILILDEPTIGLDPQARHLIWEKLRALQAQGNTIVLTTHYLDEAARLCDRLVIMDNGRILVEGAPADLVKEHAGQEIVEVEKSAEVVRCLRDMNVAFEEAGKIGTLDARQAASKRRTAPPAATLKNLRRFIINKQLVRAGHLSKRPNLIRYRH